MRIHKSTRQDLLDIEIYAAIMENNTFIDINLYFEDNLNTIHLFFSVTSGDDGMNSDSNSIDEPEEESSEDENEDEDSMDDFDDYTPDQKDSSLHFLKCLLT